MIADGRLEPRRSNVAGRRCLQRRGEGRHQLKRVASLIHVLSTRVSIDVRLLLQLLLKLRLTMMMIIAGDVGQLGVHVRQYVAAVLRRLAVHLNR